jgi:hypothetical protein
MQLNTAYEARDPRERWIRFKAEADGYSPDERGVWLAASTAARFFDVGYLWLIVG